MKKTKILLRINALLLLASSGVVQAAWQWIGPAPINGVGSEGIVIKYKTGAVKIENPSVGAISAIATVPGDANTLYISAVNGGIWKTSNAKAVEPTWVPLVDTQLPALSIASLAISPLDSNTLYAGTGSTSSGSLMGAEGFGVTRSTDAGKTWKLFGKALFQKIRLTSIVPTKLMENGKQVVLTANFHEGKGVYRSSDSGETFSQISGGKNTGLPLAGVSSLVADPSNINRLYAAIPAYTFEADAKNGAANIAGIYQSLNGGKTWSRIWTAPVDSRRILLSVAGADVKDNVIWAAVASKSSDTWTSIHKSINQGLTWTKMANIPAVGEQAHFHGAILADPNNRLGLYLSGATHSESNKIKLGCTGWTGDIHLFDGTVWNPIVCKKANNSAPHADSRFMTMDEDGNLLEADDGGIYRLSSTLYPKNQKWQSLLGNLSVSEFISVAYDPLNGLVFGGTQDNSPTYQTAKNNAVWGTLTSGDGGVVAVDAKTLNKGSSPKSIRYLSTQYLNLWRLEWDKSGKLIDGSEHQVDRHIKGSNKYYRELSVEEQKSGKIEVKPDFYNRYILNSVTPTRMLIGQDNGVYESFDQGDTLTNVPIANTVSSIRPPYQKALVYGGRTANKDNPDVFYAGFSSQPDPEPLEDEDANKITTSNLATDASLANTTGAATTASTSTQGIILFRETPSAKAVALPNYKGSGVVDLAVDPANYYRLFVLDDQNRVWVTYNKGGKWQQLTSNLGSVLSGEVRTLAVKGSDTVSPGISVVVGGGYGVAELRNPDITSTWIWKEIDKNLPNTLVSDLQYDQASHTLVAGTIGRGVWKITYQ